MTDVYKRQEEDLIALDGVVVSANRSETTRRMAPTLVNVMDVKAVSYTHLDVYKRQQFGYSYCDRFYS